VPPPLTLVDGSCASAIGFDDVSAAAALTTVHQPILAKGRLMARILSTSLNTT